MKALISSLVVLVIAVTAIAQQAQPRDEWHRGLRLEDPVREADLILAVQVEEVTEIKLMQGGKGESSMLQFRFKPLKTIKGVFARPELTLGSSDLGYRISSHLKFLKAGQKRLLFLGRSNVGYQNCNESDDSLDHAFPPIAGEGDPLLQTLATLLALNAEPNRFQRVKLLIAALEKSSGPAAVPLLAAISSRALLAAQNPETAPAINRHLADVSPAVRIAAASALQSILAADYLEQPALRENAAAALSKAFASEGSNIGVRDALINATAALRVIDDQALIARLDFTNPSHSIRESVSQLRAIGALKLTPFGDKLFKLSENLPLDAPYKADVEIALARVDPIRGAAEIERHATEGIAAGASCQGDLRAAAALPPADAAALLVRLAAMPLNDAEWRVLAQSASDVCERRPDERLVAPLAKLLDPDQPETRTAAVDALVRIGTLSAAQALQPHIGQEANISRKLWIAEVLGKNGMMDGYPYAIEHVSESGLTEGAIEALVAMKDPRTLNDAKTIFETSNDAKWNSAAIRILGALGAREFTAKFLGLAADWKNPLSSPALIALADLGESQALPRIREALNSRSADLAIAGTEAAAHLLKRPEIMADDIRDQLAALLASGEASGSVRNEALDALLALKDPRLDHALVITVSEAALERTSLLEKIEAALRDRKLKLP